MPTFTRMLDDFVHVRVLEAAERTPSGKLFLPETALTQRQRAEVLCAGPNAVGIEPGMVVELDSYAGDALDEDTMVVRVYGILGIWED